MDSTIPIATDIGSGAGDGLTPDRADPGNRIVEIQAKPEPFIVFSFCFSDPVGDRNPE